MWLGIVNNQVRFTTNMGVTVMPVLNQNLQDLQTTWTSSNGLIITCQTSPTQNRMQKFSESLLPRAIVNHEMHNQSLLYLIIIILKNSVWVDSVVTGDSGANISDKPFFLLVFHKKSFPCSEWNTFSSSSVVVAI